MDKNNLPALVEKAKGLTLIPSSPPLLERMLTSPYLSADTMLAQRLITALEMPGAKMHKAAITRLINRKGGRRIGARYMLVEAYELGAVIDIVARKLSRINALELDITPEIGEAWAYQLIGLLPNMSIEEVASMPSVSNMCTPAWPKLFGKLDSTIFLGIAKACFNHSSGVKDFQIFLENNVPVIAGHRPTVGELKQMKRVKFEPEELGLSAAWKDYQTRRELKERPEPAFIAACGHMSIEIAKYLVGHHYCLGKFEAGKQLREAHECLLRDCQKRTQIGKSGKFKAHDMALFHRIAWVEDMSHLNAKDYKTWQRYMYRFLAIGVFESWLKSNVVEVPEPKPKKPEIPAFKMERKVNEKGQPLNNHIEDYLKKTASK